MDRVHDEEVDEREGSLQLFPQTAFRDEDFAFQDDQTAVVQGGEGRDAEDVSNGPFAVMGRFVGLVKVPSGRFSVTAETLEPEYTGEERVFRERGFGGGPEQAGPVVVGERLESQVVLDRFQVFRDVQAGARPVSEKVVASDFLVFF